MSTRFLGLAYVSLQPLTGLGSIKPSFPAGRAVSAKRKAGADPEVNRGDGQIWGGGQAGFTPKAPPVGWLGEWPTSALGAFPKQMGLKQGAGVGRSEEDRGQVYRARGPGVT